MWYELAKILGFWDDGGCFRGGAGDRVCGFSRGEGGSEATEIVEVFWSFGGSLKRF